MVGDFLVTFNSYDLRNEPLSTYTELAGRVKEFTICEATFLRPPVPKEYLPKGITLPNANKISVHCYKCKRLYDCTPESLDTWRRHLRAAVHKIPKSFICEICEATSKKEEFLTTHPCLREKNAGINFTPYTFKETESRLVQLLISCGRPEFEIAKICIDEQIAIQNFWPPVHLPLSWRRGKKTSEHYKSLCNTSGTFFIQKILSDQIKFGGSNSLVVHRNIVIKDGEGNNLLFLTELVTKLDSKYLSVTNVDGECFEFSLVSPPVSRAKEQELDNSNLVVYQKYTKKNGFPFSPHRWPKEVTMEQNMYIKPYMFDEALLRNLVGMTVGHFWDFVDKLQDSPLPKLINMPMENLFLMFRLKLRQNYANIVLAGLFAISVDVVQERFITATIYVNHYFHPLPRLWTANEVTEEQLEAAYDQIARDLPPLYKNLADKIADPTDLNRTKTAVLSIDSIKIRTVKTSNRTKQSSMYYEPKGSQNISETHVTTLLGEVVWVSSMTASSSPRMGDSLVIMSMLDHDERSALNGKPLTHGLTRLLKGTKTTKVVLVADFGYVKIPHQCKTDHLETLEGWCERNGVVLMTPRNPKPEWILQYNSKYHSS